MTGNDITAPPNKELPPSPEKKTKVGVILRSASSLPWFFFAGFSASSAAATQVLFSELPFGNHFTGTQRPPVTEQQTTQSVADETESGFNKCVVSCV